MKVIRKNKTYRLRRLPVITNNHFIWNNIVGIAGSIFSRPVINSMGIYRHYALLLGFDKDNTLWMLEHNVNGVECITFNDFLNGQLNFRVEKCITNRFHSQIILDRAKSKSMTAYHQSDFNCEHFVNFCHTGNAYSSQVAVTKSVLDIAMSFLELRVTFNTPSEAFLDSLAESRKMLNINRSPEFQKQLDGIIAKNSAPVLNSWPGKM